jgi:putative FmdB family regulatory protein
VPTYDYQCRACDHTFEHYQRMSEEPLRTCPSCGEHEVRRLIGSGAGIIFRGSGFYETDYRSESYRRGQKADQEPSCPASDPGGKGGCSSCPAAPTGQGGSGDVGG